MEFREWLAERRSDIFGKSAIAGAGRTSKAAWTLTDGDITSTCWRRRFHTEDGNFKCRSVHLLVMQGDLGLASAKFTEWTTVDGYFAGWDQFWMAADASSGPDVECAELLARYWDDDFQPFDYGSVAIFDRLLIPTASPAVWPSLRAAIDRQFARTASLLVLKPFPLEWEGQASKAPSEGEVWFSRRYEAMKRHYRRHLGVELFPHGNDKGWMWRSMRFCPTPEFRGGD